MFILKNAYHYNKVYRALTVTNFSELASVPTYIKNNCIRLFIGQSASFDGLYDILPNCRRIYYSGMYLPSVPAGKSIFGQPSSPKLFKFSAPNVLTSTNPNIF